MSTWDADQSQVGGFRELNQASPSPGHSSAQVRKITKRTRSSSQKFPVTVRTLTPEELAARKRNPATPDFDGRTARGKRAADLASQARDLLTSAKLPVWEGGKGGGGFSVGRGQLALDARLGNASLTAPSATSPTPRRHPSRPVVNGK